MVLLASPRMYASVHTTHCTLPPTRKIHHPRHPAARRHDSRGLEDWRAGISMSKPQARAPAAEWAVWGMRACPISCSVEPLQRRFLAELHACVMRGTDIWIAGLCREGTQHWRRRSGFCAKAEFNIRYSDAARRMIEKQLVLLCTYVRGWSCHLSLGARSLTDRNSLLCGLP